MQDSNERNHDPENDDEDRDGIRERPGDLKDDGSTRERSREGGWDPEDEDDRTDGHGRPRDN